MVLDGLHLFHRERFSPSFAIGMDACPAQLAWTRTISRMGLEEVDPLSPAAVGQVVHRALELFYSRPRRDRVHDRLMVDLGLAVSELDLPEHLSEALLASCRGKLERLEEIEDPREVHVFGVEERLLCDIGGAPFEGVVDRVDIIPPDSKRRAFRARVVDFKTGRMWRGDGNAKYERQILLYAAALREVHSFTPAMGALFFLQSGYHFFVRIDRDRLNDCSAWFRERVDEWGHMFDRERFDLKPGVHCKWCPLAPSCPAGPHRARAGLRVEALPVTGGEDLLDEPW